MSIYELIALPVYLGVVYLLANLIRGNHSGDKLYDEYFIKGLNYRVIGVLGFTVIYWFYYKGGDSINFYWCVTPTLNYLFTSPSSFFSFVLSPTSQYPDDLWYELWLHEVNFLARGSASLTTIKIGCLINMVTFNSYIGLNLILSFIVYLCIWRAFQLFVKLYPPLKRELAIAFLMLPSLIFWSSGFGKDSIVLAAVMYLFCSYYDFVLKKKHTIANVIGMGISFYVISLIRGYVLYTVSASLMLMTSIYYRNIFRNAAVRFIALPVFVAIGMGGAYMFINSIGSSASSYSVDTLQKTAEGFHSWHTQVGGSTYSLGDDVDYSLKGVIRKAPRALIIALFGPFIWQVRNPVMMMSGIESLIFLFLFLKVFFDVRIYQTYKILFQDHIIIFCAAFVIILAIAIGITAFNYGALVRYRTPILPMFVTLISVVNLRLFGKGLLKSARR